MHRSKTIIYILWINSTRLADGVNMWSEGKERVRDEALYFI